MFGSMPTMSPNCVTDNVAEQRFECVENGQVVFAEYYRRGETVVIPHVEAPPALRGTGAAGRFMEALANHARKEGLKLLPTCGYAALWFRRHRDFQDVLA